jgi:hypothetical protein
MTLKLDQARAGLISESQLSCFQNGDDFTCFLVSYDRRMERAAKQINSHVRQCPAHSVCFFEGSTCQWSTEDPRGEKWPVSCPARLLFICLFIDWLIGVWTQGFALARHVLYSLRHTSAFFALFILEIMSHFLSRPPGPQFSYFTLPAVA